MIRGIQIFPTGGINLYYGGEEEYNRIVYSFHEFNRCSFELLHGDFSRLWGLIVCRWLFVGCQYG